ncbi:MAG: hypothetical protein JWQ42_1603 [Edaphobacter sp.]|nr:hypothetical protein [Edaphobacter sp.]
MELIKSPNVTVVTKLILTCIISFTNQTYVQPMFGK